MEANLAQLYLQSSEPLDNSIRSQVVSEILMRYENPESFLEILSILSDADEQYIVKSNAAVGLKKVIKKHTEFLISDLQSNNEQSALNNLLQILHEENHPMISLYIITSLIPIFESIGDSWEQLTNLFTALFDSTDSNNINKGLQLMSDFLPYASDEFVSEHLMTISQFIQSALDSSESDTLIHGIKLFSSILKTEIPISEFSENFYEIFKRSLIIFHKFLAEDDSQRGTDAAVAISQVLSCNPLFAPPTEIYELLFQILSDQSISVEIHHLPLIPIRKLLKHYGNLLQDLFPQSVEFFFTISALQFNDVGYDSLDGSTSIIDLFNYMTSSINDPNEFINSILQNVCTNDSAAESFASICALIGLVESSCQQIEFYSQRIVEYCVDRAKLGSLSVTQGILRLIYELIKTQQESMTDCASELCNFLFQLYEAHQDETIIQQSLDAICFIFYSLNLERSFVIDYVPKLIQSYQEASQSLKPNFMQCLSGSIITCQEDSAAFAELLLPIIIEGSQSTSEYDIDNRSYCIEALGDFLAFIPEKCESIYEDSIKIILSASTDEHFLLRSSGLRSLINIIKYGQGELPIDFTRYALNSAKVAMSLEIPESEHIYAQDDSSYSIVDIVTDGFRLFRFLLKYHTESCEPFFSGFSAIFKSAMISRAPVKIVALKTAAYAIYKIPEKILIFDSIYMLITEPDTNDYDDKDDEIDIVSVAFDTLKKIITKSEYENQLIDQHMERFMEVALAGIAHKLPCQRNSFEYNKRLTKSLNWFLISCIREKFALFPADNFMQVISEVINELNERESFKIFEVISMFIEEGGPVNEEIVMFGLNKLQFCDFSHSEEPISFVQALVRRQPQFLEDKMDQIIPFFLQQLSADPVPLKHYKPTIIQIISTLFALIFSDAFDIEVINSDQCIGLILSRLPVKGEHDPIFIYNSIMQLITERPKQMNNFIPEILRVFVQTLAFNQNDFEKFETPDDNFDLVVKMINSVKYIFENYPKLEEQIPEILDNDKVKLDHFVARMNKFGNS